MKATANFLNKSCTSGWFHSECWASCFSL